MARLARVSIPNILYYITSIATRDQKLFNDEKDYLGYLELLKQSKAENNFKLFAFSLLPKHLHLLIELKPETNISEVMQNLHTAYTKYYNSRYKKKGAVFQQRYKLTYVEKEPNLLSLTKYIHLNALKLKLADVPQDYSYSSYPLYLTPDQISDSLRLVLPDIKEEIQEVLGNIKKPDKKGTYEEFVLDINKDRTEYISKALDRGGFLGSEDFIEETKKEIHLRSEEKKEKEAAEIIKTRPVTRKSFIWSGSIAILILGFITIYFYTENWRREKEYQEKLERQEAEVHRLMQELRKVEKRWQTEQADQQGRVEDIADLDGSVWAIKLTVLSGQEAGRTYKDKLTFYNKKILSHRLDLAGYPSSYYTVKELDNNTIVWQSMQTSKTGATATWYVERRGGNMKGVLSQHLPGGQKQNFSFVSISYHRKK